MQSIGDLMQDYHGGWGLRGDPVLWDHLRAMLSETPLPTTLADLHKTLHSAFQTATGHPLNPAQQSLAVEALRKPNGGMSNGMVSPAFWVEKAFPFIEAAYLNETNQP